MLLAMLSLAWAQDPPAPPAPTESGRMSFDDRVVKGQVAAGSVYLFQRNPRALPALVAVRRSYRAEILAPLIAERPPPPADER